MPIYAYDVLSGNLSVYVDGALNNTVSNSGAPGTSDNTYTAGQIWVDSDTATPYILVDVTAGVATWQELGSGGSVPDATETVRGIIELATQAETDAGTDDERAVTPLKLQSKSGLQSFTVRDLAANNTVNTKEIVFFTGVSHKVLTIPASATMGDFIYFINASTSTFELGQNAGQYIRMGNQVSTTGVTGTLASTEPGDAFMLTCFDGTNWQVINAVGNLELT